MKRQGYEKAIPRRGVTIVEGVVALFVFGLFIASACKLIVVSREAATRAQDHYAAINLAKNRLERIQGFDFFVLNQCVQTNYYMDRSGNAADPATAKFRSHTSVSGVTTNLKLVVVNVEIKDRVTLEFDGEHEEIVTYLSQPRTLDEIM